MMVHVDIGSSIRVPSLNTGIAALQPGTAEAPNIIALSIWVGEFILLQSFSSS
jgi:hypothetical protein